MTIYAANDYLLILIHLAPYIPRHLTLGISRET